MAALLADGWVKGDEDSNADETLDLEGGRLKLDGA